MNSSQIIDRLSQLGNPEIAAHSSRFFKTGPGQYGEGDRFLGIRVPVIRKKVRAFQDISLETTLEILKSAFHEARLFALLVMVRKYTRSKSMNEKRDLYRMYLDNTRHINNWDLVDTTAEHIPGAYLFTRSRKPLYRLARSASLWERRIAIMSTFYFIRRMDFADTLNLCEKLLSDREDLIHKATGWMLREVGNRDREKEQTFLNKHCTEMPRAMLRYAIEKFPEDKRRHYLKQPKSQRKT